MTIRHLQIFREVALEGNFTRAAQKLYITQSAVSHALKELEQEAGTALFDRLAKSVRLTAAGERLLEEAIPVLSSCEELENKLGHLEEESVLRIVSCITIGGFWLPAILGRFQKAFPKTPVRVEVVSAASAMEILKQGKADIALIEGNVLPEIFLGKKFASYRMYPVAAPDYVKKPVLSLEELLEEKLLLREQGSAVRDTFESRVKLAGYPLEASWTSVNSQVLIEAAKQALGITILPEVLIKRELEEGSLKKVKVEGLELENDLTAVIHRDKYQSGSLLRFWNLLEESANS